MNLKATGVHNINLVTPSHYTPAILQALQGGIGLPVVFNCGGYEKVETLKRWEGKVDIYLPDMKYADPALSDKFSKAENYPSVAKAAILEMFRQVGPVETDEDGLLKKGVCIRHLILPGHTKNTLGVIEWVANTFAPGEVLFSLMSQYTPTPAVKDHPTLGRRITKREYEKCLNALWEADLDTGYVQDLSSAKEEYTPPFDLTGI